MTNELAKQKAIRKAWGERYESVKDQLNKNGGLAESTTHQPAAHNGWAGSISASYYQPKELYGIETNNGWIRIEPDLSNLPEHDTVCKIVADGDVLDENYTFSDYNGEKSFSGDNVGFMLDPYTEVSHWKPFIRDKPQFGEIMKYSKNQIQKLERLARKAETAEQLARSSEDSLCAHIIEMFGVEGNIDYLQGDGHGFTPISNNDTHVHVEDLIKAAKQSIDITENWMLDNLTI